MKPGIINTAKMHNEQLKPLIAWLEANSINPYRLKRDQKIIFTGNRVTYSEVVETQHRRGGRRPVINRMTNEAKFQRRTKRIRWPPTRSRRSTSQHGTHVLMLGTMLIAQATDLEALERVRAGLEHRHPDRKQP